MGNPAGVRRDFAALEKRRMQAARLLEKGYSQSEVARRVGAHRQSVSLGYETNLWTTQRVASIRWNSVSVISQTVTNYTDPYIYFAWAAVLEESHYSNDSDNFTLQLVDNTTNTSLINLTYNSYDNGSIFHLYGYWYYTDWQIEKLDVSALQGHDFNLTLLGSDCPYGGHAGYVYLDGFGAAPPPPSVPEPGTLAMAGSGIVLAAGWVRRRFF